VTCQTCGARTQRNLCNRHAAELVELVANRMVFDRVVLIGDAAATARPHVGMGIAKAGTDVEVLADSLSENAELCEGLRQFGRQRLPVAARAVSRAATSAHT